MKNKNNRGFSIPVVIAIMAGFAALGGVLFYNMQPEGERMMDEGEAMMEEGAEMVKEGDVMMEDGDKMAKEGNVMMGEMGEGHEGRELHLDTSMEDSTN